VVDSKNQTILKAKYVILCNGFNSNLRDNLDIGMAYGGRMFYKLINIHFRSKELAKALINKGSEAMLHFIYNNRIPCVLVNHSF